jgi:hypothetical protein
MARNEEDQELIELQKENLRIQSEHLREQTLYYRDQNAAMRGQRENREHRHAQQEETLRINREKLERIQRACTHKKGGKGDDLVKNKGSDPNYAVIHHVMEWGEEYVKCTRCTVEWWPGDTAENHPSGIGYEAALQFSTDNVGGGAAQFRVDPRVVAELRARRLAQRGYAADGKTRLPGLATAAA